MTVLIKFRSDWADEFDCEQLHITDMSVLEVSEKIQKNINVNDGLYFGTNEGFEPGELTMDNFTITEITDVEAATIKKLIGTTFGTGIIDHIIEYNV